MSEPVLREHESGHDMVRIFYWLPWQKCKERIGEYTGIYNYSSIYNTGSKSVTLEAFDVTGVIRQR